MDTARHSAVIIGAGAVGAALAHHLTASGTPVTVVEGAAPASGASGAGFAWVNAAHKSPESYRRLNAGGVSAHHAWRARLPDASWFHPTGNVEFAPDARSAAAMEDHCARLESAGYPARRLGAAELDALLPGVRPPSDAGAFCFADEGWVDAPAMVRDLLRRAVAGGAELVTGDPVVGFGRRADGRVRELLLGSGRRIEATDYVLAAGNGASALLGELGAPDPLTPTEETPAHSSPDSAPRPSHPTVGMVVETTGVRDAPRSVVQAPGVSFRPAPGGGLALTDHPTAARWSRSDPRLWEVPRLLLDRAARVLPALGGAHVARVHVGERVLPRDGYTVAGRLPEAANTYLVATHSGVTLAPFLAELVTDELRGTVRGELSGFRPDRFARG